MNVFERLVVSAAIICVSLTGALLLYRLAEKFQLESFMVKQMLVQMGVQLP